MRQFYGRLEKCVLSAGKTRVHKIPPFRGGWGGGSADFIFMGARIFLIWESPKQLVSNMSLFPIFYLEALVCAILRPSFGFFLRPTAVRATKCVNIR